MSKTSNLSVYQESYKLSFAIFKLVKKFPKELKHTLGKQFFNSSLSLLTQIIKINRQRIKYDLIEDAITEMELLFAFARMSLDFVVISKGEYQVLSEKMAEVLSQLNSWYVWDKKKIQTANITMESTAVL